VTEPSTTVVEVEVGDDSILAHKTLTIRPITKMKLKHLRAFQRVASAGRSADMDDMALALAGALIGWTEDEVNELSLDEMLLVIGKLGEQRQNALPNGTSSPSPQPSPRTMRGRGRTGSKQSS
jgi:hypothetical protein